MNSICIHMFVQFDVWLANGCLLYTIRIKHTRYFPSINTYVIPIDCYVRNVKVHFTFILARLIRLVKWSLTQSLPIGSTGIEIYGHIYVTKVMNGGPNEEKQCILYLIIFNDHSCQILSQIWASFQQKSETILDYLA